MRERRGTSFAPQVTFAIFRFVQREAGTDESLPAYGEAMTKARREAETFYGPDGESWLTRDLQDSLPF